MPVAESELSVSSSSKKSDAAEASREQRLSHLRLLEAESIHILREVASEFERPVMLYSIGKDSSVMLRLAQKAFYPGPIPFPLLHIDTGFKFREMIAFRDETARQVGAELLVWRNEPAIAAGANPIKLDTKRCCGLLKTQALLDGLRHYKFEAAFGVARQGANLLVPRLRRAVGSVEPAAGAVEPGQRANPSRRKHPRVPLVELDRDGRLAIHPRGKHTRGRPVLCQRAADVRARRCASAHRAGFYGAAGREAADGEVPVAFPRLQPLHGGHSIRCGDPPRDYCRADLLPFVRTRKPRDRS